MLLSEYKKANESLVFDFHIVMINSPTRPVGEDDVALLRRPLSEGHTCVFLPVTHRLTENGSLTAWKETPH